MNFIIVRFWTNKLSCLCVILNIIIIAAVFTFSPKYFHSSLIQTDNELQQQHNVACMFCNDELTQIFSYYLQRFIRNLFLYFVCSKKIVIWLRLNFFNFYRIFFKTMSLEIFYTTHHLGYRFLHHQLEIPLLHTHGGNSEYFWSTKLHFVYKRQWKDTFDNLKKKIEWTGLTHIKKMDSYHES